MDKEILIQAGEWQIYQKEVPMTKRIGYYVVSPHHWDICLYREGSHLLFYPPKETLHFNCLEILKQTNTPIEIKMFIETLVVLNEL